MRVLVENSVKKPSCDAHQNANIPLHALCETTKNAQSTSKRRPKKYRAVERSDGVIVERPRYRPAASQQKAVSQSHPERAFLHEHTFSSKEIKDGTSSRMTYDLLGVGCSRGNTMHVGHCETTRIGREGFYGAEHRQWTIVGIEMYTSERRSFVESNPIDRFLHESGPWSSCSQRGEETCFE
ncbi:hypothetical protein COCC4DRAFT_65438 [Bipolaris maydis ATCC 48331]|uniref:Uncharacterized protein n=2 Tax=Cochliobolus heterostrophus TaxID=5016 RepID=M2U9U9_COCH5|nr:uncharacterized protein COCC4DRAFT_65438 [Bipolaris maydis ATCC 48331]EMD95344.1 hypothetical protein COCHEDRAFT_1091122 [Bipolaris maydis C5]KAJ5055121.1 hypothetical protein J3E74DRAFT_228172 [Bipolaris maydis]ENI00491.1 hypothetical protein COCC4DRAFT_65438 [Bipolaris maydis ATCC 48331]KAJ6191829.1 hypothetical protein J3E72DRAFT_205272 [Bipolaris maydis]KAJ6202995.1 hypothetical protein J3E72DRAFT_178511 [Bipolaris maydis]